MLKETIWSLAVVVFLTIKGPFASQVCASIYAICFVMPLLSSKKIDMIEVIVGESKE